ncbi:hypothetical protein NHQ30_000327 [Ciborinia camelliae]|nr:hypothetical protein NHQ30_000327 [Ciborinia camelliae]
MKEVEHETEIMREGFDDDSATSIIKLCHNTINSIEMNRATKLRVWKKLYQVPQINGFPIEKHSAKYKKDIVDKYYEIHKTLPALEKLQEIDQARKVALAELNTQVLAAEQWEKYEDSMDAEKLQAMTKDRQKLGEQK